MITADGGKRRAAPKLPAVCSDLGLTHVTLWGSLHHAKTDEKRLALMEVFQNLDTLRSLPPGTQVRLSKKTMKGGAIGYELRVGAKSIGSFIEDLQSRIAVSTDSAPPGDQPELF